jgi:hypothetical protein
VAIAALSLIAAHQTTYDPTAWLIWGREIIHWDLTTTVGPSWKPLPVFITTPSALLGATAQQAIWLVVARTGGLVAVVLAYRLAARFGGWAAGVIAAVSLVVAGGMLSQVFRGDSEGLLAALALGAVLAHLNGRRWGAFALVVATNLLRPEMLLFVGGYGLWLVLDAAPRERKRTLLIVVGAIVGVIALWLIPEEIGSGQLLRAASRAREPVANSPAQAAFPFLAVFTNAAPVLPWPVYAGGFAAVVLALRDRGLRVVLVLAGLATTVMLVVAAMAQGGFTGNARYLAIAIALTCVLGGIGWAWLYREARSRWSPRWAAVAAIVAVVVAAPSFLHEVKRTRNEMRGAFDESSLNAALPAAIAKAGGRDAIVGCGGVYSAPTDTQVVARDLRLHEKDVGIHPRPPGTVFAQTGSSLADDGSFPHVLASTERWVVRSTC